MRLSVCWNQIFPFQMFRSELYGGSNSQSKYEVEMYFRQSAPARI